MEDFAGRIQSILSDEESLKQIGELAQMLGLGAPPSAESSSPMSLPVSEEGQGPQNDVLSGIDIGAVMKLVSGFNSEDDNIRFIIALKPLLSEEKRAKADTAVKLLKLVNLIPLIKESGLLGGDFLGIL